MAAAKAGEVAVEAKAAVTARAAEGRLHSATRQYQSRVAASLDAIRLAAERGRIGVSFSGGKDSLVTLHLVRSVVPNVACALFDSGCELPDTLALAEHYGATIIPARLSYLDMARYSGWWGYQDPVDAGCPFDVKAILIDEPSVAFIVRERLSVCAMGLRAQESSGRRMNAKMRGMLYQGADRTWYLCPLADWSTDDVWAYIHSNSLRYHPAYDAMERIGIAPDKQRLGMTMGMIGIRDGSVSVLRKCAPAQFAKLAAEFPMLREMQ